MKNLTVDHPDIRYVTHGAAPIVFVFERNLWKEPTEDEVEKYQLRKAIVEAHGGHMISPEYAIAGKNAPFTEDDCTLMIQKTLESNQDLYLYEPNPYWNGAGCYTFSVGCRKQNQGDVK